MFRSRLAAAVGRARAVLLTTVTLSASPIYDYTVIARAGDMFDGKILARPLEHVSLNNAGTVAFQGLFQDGSVGIVTQHGIVAQTGDVIEGRTLGNYLGQPSINDAGTVAFYAEYLGENAGTVDEGVFTQDKLVAGRGTTISGITLTRALDLAINNEGTVAFNGVFFEDSHPFAPHSAIFTSEELICRNGSVIDGYTFDEPVASDPSINDAGTVLFASGFLWSGNFNGIFTQDHRVLGPGDVVDGTSLNVYSSTSINNSGTIAFNGYEFRDCSSPGGCQIYPNFPGVNGIFTQDKLLVEEGSMLDGRLLSYIPPLGTAINEAGTVAFHGFFTGGSGLFTQEGFVAGTGTVIDGRAINYVSSLGRIALNDHGDLAFHALFKDGSEAIVLATRADASIPEPSATQMTGMGVAMLIAVSCGSRFLRNRASIRSASRAWSCPPECR